MVHEQVLTRSVQLSGFIQRYDDELQGWRLASLRDRRPDPQVTGSL